MSELLLLDEWLFYKMNGSWTNVLFDNLLPFWRNKYLWIPLYLFLISFIWANFRPYVLYILIGMLLSIGISDTLSSKIIKPSVSRVRPCNNPLVAPYTNLLIKCGSGKSFTSSHATNHFTLAVFLSSMLGFLGIGRIRWLLYFWAASISYGQVYVGVHYPLDILGGALLGSLIGFLVSRVVRLYISKYRLEAV